LQALGKHVLAELYGCDREVLNSPELIENYMKRAAIECGATIVNSVFHSFNPHGISGVVVIAESHLAIHTWPEYGYAAVDVFTCGITVNPQIAIDRLKEYLLAKYIKHVELNRGELKSRKILTHKPVLVDNNK
jgi:S-adenosylmethionine decarboxylase proenzyme